LKPLSLGRQIQNCINRWIRSDLHDNLISITLLMLPCWKEKIKWSWVFNNFHESHIGGHSRTELTYRRIKEQFYWKGLQRDVKRFIRKCVICQRFKSVNHLQDFFNLCLYLLEHESQSLWTSSLVCLSPMWWV